MLDEDVGRLSEPYPSELLPDGPSLLRLAGPLGLNLENAVLLGDEIFNDLDVTGYGIGWWQTYADLDQQVRIFLSDYLVACARAIPDNLVEARIERLELDHAVEDYRTWMSRGMDATGWSKVEAPQSAYEELSNQRVRTHLAGALRAWGSSLDCVAGCIIGVTGLPADLVKADTRMAQDSLAKHSPGTPPLERLLAALDRAEADAGPTGWREWLLGMRNTVVHRGRRTTSWSGNMGPSGVLDFGLRLPIAPDRTEVDAIVLTGGAIAASFEAPAADMLNELAKTVETYINDACYALTSLWRERRADPSLLAQDPRQWKTPKGLITLPAFHGFPHLVPSASVTTSYNASPEDDRRLRSAAIRPDIGDIKPDPKVWS